MARCLGTLVGDPSVDEGGALNADDVYGVHPDEEEGKEEEINVGRGGLRAEEAQLIGAEVAFPGWGALD